MLYSVLRQLISGGEISATTMIVQVLVSVFVVFCVLPVHEFAHAFAAYKLGDNTPKYQGRLTLNPLAHLDLLGAVMIMLFGFGYAKPVAINPFNFKNRKRDTVIVALAGPFSNLLMAFIYLAIYKVLTVVGITNTFMYAVGIFCVYASTININLAVFNLLPVPPLDGSRILAYVIPERYYFKMQQYQRQITIAVLVLLALGVLTIPLNFLSGLVAKLFMFILRIK